MILEKTVRRHKLSEVNLKYTSETIASTACLRTVVQKTLLNLSSFAITHPGTGSSGVRNLNQLMVFLNCSDSESQIWVQVWVELNVYYVGGILWLEFSRE